MSVLCRGAAMALLLGTVFWSYKDRGGSPTNIPFWISVGMLSLYACYSCFGLEFGNGQSVSAELWLASIVTIAALGFRLGAHRIRRHKKRLSGNQPILLPRCSGRFTVLAAVGALLFFSVLTNGQPWRILTEGVELKWERLNAAADKDPTLLLLDAAVFASILVGLSWAIIGYRDDRRSAVHLGAFTALALCYTVSTGSRTPLIAVGAQAVAAVAFGKKNSRFIAQIAKSSGLIFLSVFLTLAFMIAVTASRIEFEQLDSAVFEHYFDIENLGAVEPLTQKGAGGFFLATLITYAASTYNNAVIRIQELDSITLSYGYKFVFFYLTGLRGITGGLLEGPVVAWRDLATVNNTHLLSISPSATQWATLFGDAIWDFGIPLTLLLVALVSYKTGSIIERARRQSRLSLHLLAILLISISLAPLVNPFLSLHVHFMFFIIGGLHLTTRTRLRSTRRRVLAQQQAIA